MDFFAAIAFVINLLFWVWFAYRLNGIHAETKRGADAVEALLYHEKKRDIERR